MLSGGSWSAPVGVVVLVVVVAGCGPSAAPDDGGRRADAVFTRASLPAGSAVLGKLVNIHSIHVDIATPEPLTGSTVQFPSGYRTAADSVTKPTAAQCDDANPEVARPPAGCTGIYVGRLEGPDPVTAEETCSVDLIARSDVIQVEGRDLHRGEVIMSCP